MLQIPNTKLILNDVNRFSALTQLSEESGYEGDPVHEKNVEGNVNNTSAGAKNDGHDDFGPSLLGTESNACSIVVCHNAPMNHPTSSMQNEDNAHYEVLPDVCHEELPST